MNETDIEYIKNIDRIFIVVGCIVNPLGIIFNTILIYLILRKTRKSLRSFSILLLNFAICDFGSSLSGLLSLQKTIFSGNSLTYIFHGVCSKISPFFCYFLHAFVCHLFAHSQWILMVSFLYRYYIIVRTTPRPEEIVKLCLIVYIPSFLFLIIYLCDAGDPDELTILIYTYHENLKYDNKNIWGDLTIAGNKSVWSWISCGAIVYMTIPCFPIYGCIIFFRHKALNILNHTGRVLMSDTTRKSHRALIKALTIQAIVPVFWLTASTLYLLLLFRKIDGVVMENLPFRIMEIMPVLTPLISMFFVSPYRKCVKAWMKRTKFSKNTASVMFNSIHPTVNV
ncbi:unnamed protein product [Caenorhabditis bovis]|uniref:G-protein coupled receptors family 1 profile domain-containing protein n=1 Tax=Caenorhabditis bovis TaxID=2654633 RepID=A0A8S1FB94_9PELO|nr:unnamed protein product [Caenorhabditis bovis]